MAKGPEAFRTISEASDEVGVPQHVLRFWETRFSFIRPMKRAGGRRFYRPRDIETLKEVRRLLHEEGLSIADVQARYRTRRRLPVEHGHADDLDVPAAEAHGGLEAALAQLESAKVRLDRLLARR